MPGIKQLTCGGEAGKSVPWLASVTSFDLPARCPEGYRLLLVSVPLREPHMPDSTDVFTLYKRDVPALCIRGGFCADHYNST